MKNSEVDEIFTHPDLVTGEVIGNAFKQDDKKLNDDREKMLKGESITSV